MTSQESFKRRVRARMAKTGERYNAARRSLIEQAERPGGRNWASEPELGDQSVRRATGRGWDEWCDLIDAWPGRVEGHTAVARWLREEHGLDGWWAQGVTGGWERITGRRLPGQMADGTFTIARSRTVDIDVDALRAALLDDAGRADLFPGTDTELRSRATAKTLRIGIGPGHVLIALDRRPDGRTRVTASHEKLPTREDLDEWRHYWTEWLDALAG